MFRTFILLSTLLLSVSLSFGQTSENSGNSSLEKDEVSASKISKRKKKRKKYKLPKVDLSHWKVTIPVGEPKIIEVDPPEILDYATNEVLKPYMYNDSTKGALVFHAVPAQTTTNTKYSRSELREQMVPGNNSVNWTFAQGGKLKVKMAMDKISRDENGKYHKTIITQIHGRLTNEQRDEIGQKDNNAPPILKIYWQNGKIRVKTKKLRTPNIGPVGILKKEAWVDDEGFNFEQNVGFKKFTIEVEVEEGKMVISLNGQEYKTYEGIHMQRWGVFENYFKVGNYLQTRDENAYADIRVYDIEVKH